VSSCSIGHVCSGAFALEQIDQTASKDLNNDGFMDECHLEDADVSGSCPQYIEQYTEPTTLKGCKCKSNCGAHDGVLFRCDWCYTENGCGISTMIPPFQTYDYCHYLSNENYEKQTWQTKSRSLWKKLTENDTRGDFPKPEYLLVESVQTSFDNQWDHLPHGRKKVLHGVGSVCRVRLRISANSPYTGILAAGEISEGFIRMGSAIKMKPDGIVPGNSIKFMRTGVHSANLLTLHKVSSKGLGWDHFINQSTHVNQVENFKQWVGGQKFNQATNCINKLGHSDLCTWSQNGTKAAEPIFPWIIHLEPGNIHFPPNIPVTVDELMNEYSKIPERSLIYTLHAKASPKAELEHVGVVETASKCQTSQYGDKKLFFRHQRIEEDFALRPEWLKEIDDDEKPCDPGPASTEVSVRQCARDAL